MQPTQWSGVISNVSPHAIPNGAAVDQMNLGTEVAGQLTSRGGMRIVQTVPDGGALDVHGYMSGGYYYAIYLTNQGGIVTVKGPSYGDATGSPSEPSLVVTGKQSATSYTQKCISALEDI
jgi:hypothetical protein